MRARKGELVGDGVAAVVDEGGVVDNVAGGDVIVAVDRVVGVVGAIYLVVLAFDMANDIVDFGGVDTVVVAAVDAIAAVDRVVGVIGAVYFEMLAVDVVGVTAVVDGGVDGRDEGGWCAGGISKDMCTTRSV